MLNISKGIILILVITFFQGSFSLNPINHQVKLVLYTTKLSFDDAQAVCKSTNGRLFTEDSNEKWEVLLHYVTYTDHFWVGKYKDTKTNNYGLANGQYLSQCKDVKCAVRHNPDDFHYHDEGCNKQKPFLCESIRDECTYSIRQGKYNIQDNQVLTLDDIDSCVHACNTRTLNNKNCWALYWSALSNSANCVLYFVDDPFQFETAQLLQAGDGSQRDPDHELRIKQCYSYEQSSVVPNSANIQSDRECRIFDTTTTTSTTSTTTTTTPTTTTTTPTTTTTTPTTTTTTPTTTTTTPTTTTPTTTTTTPTTTTTTPTTTTPTTTTTTPTTTTTTPTTTTTTPTTTPTTTTTTPTTTTTTPTTTTTSPTTTTTSPTTTTPTAATPTTTTATQITAITTTPTTTTDPATTTTPTTTTTPATTTTPTTKVTPTSRNTTTTQTAPTTASPRCNCSRSKLKKILSPLVISEAFVNLTTDEKVTWLQKRLKLEKDDLSSTERKKKSINDNRTESKVVGIAGLSLVGSVLVSIACLDAVQAVEFLLTIFKTMWSFTARES